MSGVHNYILPPDRMGHARSVYCTKRHTIAGKIQSSASLRGTRFANITIETQIYVFISVIYRLNHVPIGSLGYILRPGGQLSMTSQRQAKICETRIYEMETRHPAYRSRPIKSAKRTRHQ